MCRFQYYFIRKDQKWSFHLIGTNKKLLISSVEQYDTEDDCLEGIKWIRKMGGVKENYRPFTGSEHKYYFTLHDINGEPLGKSEAYENYEGRNRGMALCAGIMRFAVLTGLAPVVRRKRAK